MFPRSLLPSGLLLVPALTLGATPTLPGIGAAEQAAVDADEVAGAVTAVVTPDRTVQRSDFPNSDASDVRRAFQAAAVAALLK